MEKYCSKATDSLSDYFKISLANGKRRLEFNLNIDAFKSFFEENVFYTIFEKKKIFFYIEDGKEVLINNLRSIVSPSNFISQVKDLVLMNSGQYQAGVQYKEYINVLLDKCGGLSYQVVTKWITEKHPSRLLMWKIEYVYDTTSFRRKTKELLIDELLSAGFKVTKDETGKLFCDGGNIYYKSLGEKYYILFGECSNKDVIDSCIVYSEDIDNVSSNFLRPIKKFPIYEEYPEDFILDFSLATHYPILLCLISDARKYDFFYDIVADYHKTMIDEYKTKMGW